MQRNIFKYVMLAFIIISILIIIVLSVYIGVSKPRDLTNYISVENITSIKVSSSVPEASNKRFDFDLTNDEMQIFIKLIKSSSVKRILGENKFDGVGFTISITYSDGMIIDIPYREYIMIDDNWYQIYGYVFEYVYETDSYKSAYESAK